MQIIRACIIAVVILGLCLGWPRPTHAQPNESPPTESDWTYQDATGPDYWAALAPDFATCSDGQSQSPINLTAAAAADLANPEFHYESVPLNLLNNGHTIQVPYAPGSYVTIDARPYHLLQFHFHSPSEHAVNGHQWDAELHLVHQNDAGELAVVAVLLQANDIYDNAVSYDTLSTHLPSKAGDKVRTDEIINAQDLLPNKNTTYRYSGSLTTPPCSESVTWLVMTEPVNLSAQQLTRYKALLNRNNRPLQLLNNRPVQIDTSP